MYTIRLGPHARGIAALALLLSAATLSHSSCGDKAKPACPDSLPPFSLPSCVPQGDALGARVELTLAVIGDYGSGAPCEQNVRDLIDRFAAQFQPIDAIITTGDNAYSHGTCEDFKVN